MNPSDIRLDALGFPIPRTFDDLPGAKLEERVAKAETSNRRRHGTFTLRALLVIVAIGAGVMALVRAGVAEPVNGMVADWLARHATEKYATDNLDGALLDLDRAMLWSDKSPAIFALRGQVRLEKGDLQGSLADFNKLIGMVPESSRAYELRSASLQRLDRHDDAIRDISEAVELRGRDPRLLNARAYTLAIANQSLDQALRDIQQAIHLEGDTAHYLDTRGYIYFLQGDYTRALADLDRALDLADNDALPGFLMSGHAVRARMLAREQRLHEQNLAVMHHHRGQVHEKLGNAELAESDLRKGDVLGYNPAAGVY